MSIDTLIANYRSVPPKPKNGWKSWSIRVLLQVVFFAVLVLGVIGCEREDYFDYSGWDELAPISLDEHFEVLYYIPEIDAGSFHGETIWIKDFYGELLRSTDRGLSWSRVDLPAEGGITYLNFFGDGTKGVVVNSDGILMRTGNGGRDWTVIDLKEKVKSRWYESLDFMNFRFDDTLQNVTWIGLCQIYRSKDGGMTWTSHADSIINSEREHRCVYDVLTVEGELRYAEVSVTGRILTSGSYLYASRDDGRTWQEVCSLDEIGILVESVTSCRDIAEKLPDWGHFADYLHPMEDAMRAFSNSADEGIFKRGSLPVPASGAWGLYKDKSANRYWYAYGGGFAYTEDEGETWSVHAGMPASAQFGAVLHSVPGSGHFLAIGGCELFISDNRGFRWRHVPVPTECVHFGVPGESGRILLMTREGLQVSDDLGKSWASVEVDGYEIHYDGGVAWLSGEGSLLRSADGGNNWRPVKVDGYVEGHACRKGGCVVASNHKLLRFEPDEEGHLVQISSAELPDDFQISDIVADKELNEIWILSYNGELLFSNDGGRTLVAHRQLRDDIGWQSLYLSPSGTSLLAAGFHDVAVVDSSREQHIGYYRTPESVKDVCWLNDDVVLLPQGIVNAVISMDRGKTFDKMPLVIRTCLADASTIYFIGGALRYKGKPENPGF